MGICASLVSSQSVFSSFCSLPQESPLLLRASLHQSNTILDFGLGICASICLYDLSKGKIADFAIASTTNFKQINSLQGKILIWSQKQEHEVPCLLVPSLRLQIPHLLDFRHDLEIHRCVRGHGGKLLGF
ncbi:hypothetical protein NIES37_47470 [Tolypothrix tenuis PCC 7101]|uniref:Uncharacterized protein n=1 Tax=Tolypothrix tenuis PCC 7101 TaxID=231146 RepID=A0A1Z4N4Y7_9CYAN|nr:hypothetical protein NIES37_47470 [Tolypothrix tenuis PCC 7101]BAZ75326.1 hypothetical protein NIES50_39080 [Aulosira laxa NIES-50]